MKVSTDRYTSRSLLLQARALVPVPVLSLIFLAKSKKFWFIDKWTGVAFIHGYDCPLWNKEVDQQYFAMNLKYAGVKSTL